MADSAARLIEAEDVGAMQNAHAGSSRFQRAEASAQMALAILTAIYSLERGVGRPLRPVDRFIRDQTSGEVLLLAAAALYMVHSSSAPGYDAVFDLKIGASVGEVGIASMLHRWVNGGLMVVLFFLLGLEVKRELIAGDVGTARRTRGADHAPGHQITA